MTPEHEAAYRRRQRSRAKVTGVILGLMAVLFFAIAIARLS